MSISQLCPACFDGNHEKHVGPWNIIPGLLGGARCDCKGDCANNDEKKRIQDQINEMFNRRD